MSQPTTCLKCGSAIPAGSPAGQCPRCLIGIASEPSPKPTTDDARAPIKERRFGDYVLGPQLGSGGMGIVYEAYQTSLNRKVALKFIRDSQVASPIQLRRFTIEAEATARLHHPGIVAIHEIGEVDGQPYYSMELVEGESLRSAIASGRIVLGPECATKSAARERQVEIARLMAKAARAMHHAHQRGVLHRDLKPANLIIDQHGEPRLTDFGLAKILRQTTDQSTQQSLTASGDIAGTPSYMSPEQASSGEITHASDIYGLGAVLYELLSGRPPFKAATPLETLKLVEAQQPRNPRFINRLVDRDLDTICMKCLEKYPRFRFASAEALAEDLENWINRKPIKARPPGPVVRVRQWVRRNPAGAGLIGTLFTAFAMTFVMLQVYKAQKTRVEMQQAHLFEQNVKRILEKWADPDRSDLTIEAGELAILDNRHPTDDVSAKHLTFGASVSLDPMSLAQQTYAPLFGKMEAAMANTLQRPLEIDLRVFKLGKPEFEPLLSRTIVVDFMVLDASSYVKARHRDPRLVPLARMSRAPSGAVVAHKDSDIRLPADLKGRTLVLPDDTSPITIWAKAKLVDAGLLKDDLRSATILSPRQGLVAHQLVAPHNTRAGIRETSTAVWKRKADAGVTLLSRYESDRHHGLTLIEEFRGTPRVFVARAGLDPLVIDAFRSALLAAGAHRPGKLETKEKADWEENFPGAVPVEDADFDGLRAAMRKAARFDGLPDPFAPVTLP